MDARHDAPAPPDDEARIREQVDRFARAFRARDLDGVLALYAPGVVSFDLEPPLRHEGLEAYRKPWEETFAAFTGTLGYEVHDLRVTTGGDLAFSHSLNRMSGTTTGGETVAFWLRWTACYRRVEGRWLVVHESVSVPVELESGRARLDLEP